MNASSEPLPWMHGGCGCGGEGLDAQSWAGGLSAVAYGAAVGLRTNGAEQLGELRSLLLAPGWSSASGGKVEYLYSLWSAHPDHLLYSQSKLVFRSPERDLVWRELRRRFFDHLALTAPPGKFLFVRGGAVEWRGRAWLIMGPPSSGKSRLVQAFVGAGAGYLSDHFAVLDTDGLVHPFSCSLALWQDRKIIPADSLGKVCEHPCRLGGLFALTGSEEGESPFSRLSQARCVELLFNQSLQTLGAEQSLRTLDESTREASGWTVAADTSASGLLAQITEEPQ